MGSHRRKWGWWLVAAIAVAVAASLFLHRRPGVISGPSGPDAPSPGAAAASSALPAEVESAVTVVRDTVYVTVADESVPVIRERKVEAGEPHVDTPAVEEEPAVASPSAASSSSAEQPAATAPPAAVETVVAVPVKVINGLLRNKSGREVTLSTSAPDKMTLTYAGKVDLPVVGGQDMNFSADFKVVEVTGDRLVLQLDSGAAMNLAADAIAPYVLKRLPAGLVDSFSGGRAVINLSAIPQLKQQLRSVEIVGFSLDNDEIRLHTLEK